MKPSASDRTRALLDVAMGAPEQYVCEIVYLDGSGNVTERVVSPIRYLTSRAVSVYCLGREEPRTLLLSRIMRTKIGLASEVLSPEAIKNLCLHHKKRLAAGKSSTGTTGSESRDKPST